MYEYAVRKKYLTENPMDKVQILVKYRQVVKKTGKTETYNTKELEDMNRFLESMYEETLERIERQGEYMFMRDGKRITANRIAVILRMFARYEGISVKSSHRMRKTYASNLNASGVPLDCIREMLGHNNLNTTLGYIYNPLTESQTYDLMAKALE